MLALPPFVARGIERSTVKPVLYAEILTALRDDPVIEYDDWTGSRVVASHRVAVDKDAVGDRTNPRARCRMLYPAQGGDPAQTVTAYELSAGLGAWNVVGEPARTWNGRHPFQTFSVRMRGLPSFTATGMQLRLRRRINGGTTPITIAMLVYEQVNDSTGTDGLWQLVGRGTVASNTLSTTFDWVSIPFATFLGALGTTVTMRASGHYLVELSYYATFTAGTHQEVEWEGSRGYEQAPLEDGGFGTFGASDIASGVLGRFPFTPEDETKSSTRGAIEWNMRVIAQPYSYDGATPNYIDLWFDLGAVPTDSGWLEAIYELPGDSKVRFRLWTSDAGQAYGTDLGATDGHTMATDGHDGAATHIHETDAITTLSRYYILRIEFLGTSDTGEVTQSLLHTPTIFSVNPIFPSVVNSSASSSIPLLGAPAIIQSISEQSTTLDQSSYILKPSEFSVTLLRDRDTAELPVLRTQAVNLPILLWWGIEDAATTRKEQLAPYMAGRIIDVRATDTTVTYVCRPYTMDLERKVPQPDLRDPNAPLIPLDFSIGWNMVDVLDYLVFSECRVQRRYKHAASWATVKAALGTHWMTKRRILEATDASELVNQLLEHIGCYLIPGEDGTIRLVQYPRSGNAVATWDDSVFAMGTTQPANFEKSIVNMAIVRWGYQSDRAKSSDDEFDLHPAIALNPTAMNELAPGSAVHVRDYYLKGFWLSGKNAITPKAGGDALGREIAQRKVNHAGYGILALDGTVALSEYAVQVGDFVNVKSRVPITKGLDGTQQSALKMLVTKKTLSFGSANIKVSLLAANDLNKPPRAAMTLSATSGTAPFSIQVDPSTSEDPDGNGLILFEIDRDYDGVNFQADYSNTNGSPISVEYGTGSQGRKRLALRVWDGKDAPSTILEAEVRCLVAPIADITMPEPQTNPGQPLNAILSGAASISLSSQIVRYRWDLNYDGVTPNYTGEGVRQVITMPYRETTVLLEVTDADGLTGTATATITGKTLAPPDVTNFFIQPQEDFIILTWDPNTDLNLEGYELRGKYEPTGSQTATFATADLLTPNGTDTLIRTTMATLATPRPYGTWSFFIKAKDRSGNYSANAASILTVFVEPKDRFKVLNKSEHDHTTWDDSAKVTNLVYETANERWYIASGADLLGELATETLGALAAETLGSLGTLASEGIYLCDSNDLTGALYGGVVLNGVRVAVTPVIGAYQGDPEQTNVITEIRIATTDTGGLPDWGAWQPASLAELTLRYLQVRVRLQQFDGSSNVGIDDILVTCDMPTVVQSTNDVNVSNAGSGTTWTFTNAFHVTPRVTGSIQAMGTTPLYLDITAKSKTAVTVKVRRVSDGVDVGSGGTQLVDLVATGA